MEHAKRIKRSRLVGETEDDVLLNEFTIESKDTVESNTTTIILEETPKPRWILQPGESQKFKIRYQPKEMGIHRHTYALSVIDGDDITYDISVRGIADVPRLDMNPNAVFSQVTTFSPDHIYSNFTDPSFEFLSKHRVLIVFSLRQCNGTNQTCDLQIEKVKIADLHDPAYFSDIGAYDFGPLLAFQQDKRCVSKH